MSGSGQRVHRAAGRDQVTGFVRVGKKGDRRLGVDQDQVIDALELGLGELGQVAQSLEGGDTGPAGQIGREGLA